MRTPKLHVSGPVTLLLLVSLWLVSSASKASAGDPPASGDEATLLVKLPRAHVRDVVALVAERGGAVVDVHTMVRLRPLAHGRTKASDAAQQPTSRRSTLPLLADGVDALAAIEGAFESVRAKQSDPTAFQLVRVNVDGLRAHVRLHAPSTDGFDSIRAALRRNPYLQSRGEGEFVTPGSAARLSDGRVRTDMVIRFRDPFAAAPVTAADARKAHMPLTTAHVEQAARDAGTTMLSVSAVRRDPNRRGGYEMISRDFTFDVATLDQLGKLLEKLRAGPGTVTSVRYQLLEDKQQPESGAKKTQRFVLRLASIRALDAHVREKAR